MLEIVKNNLSGSLAESIDNLNTSILVAAKRGDWFSLIDLLIWNRIDKKIFLTLVEYDDSFNEIDFEIVKVSDAIQEGGFYRLTVERGQQNTTARAWNSLTVIENRLTEETINNLLEKTLDSSIINSVIQDSDVFPDSGYIHLSVPNIIFMWKKFDSVMDYSSTTYTEILYPYPIAVSEIIAGGGQIRSSNSVPTRIIAEEMSCVSLHSSEGWIVTPRNNPKTIATAGSANQDTNASYGWAIGRPALIFDFT